MSGNTIKKRMEELAAALSADLHERREHAAVILLAALAGQNTFLLGPPGTAKSLLARRLASVFADSNGRYFEYLMQKFSTPEDIFGPVSIQALKKDQYERKTDGFLPSAEFAFLDEIWKSGPAILNTLLTIINEKKFRNGAEMVDAPLKTLIAASNETPPEGQGLEALYDRFIVRLYAPPIAGEDSFDEFLRGKSVANEADCGNLAIKPNEWKKWSEGMREVALSAETMQIVRAIRRQLAEKHDELGAYVSDRRWKKAAELLQAAAFFCGRQKTNLADTLLLRHCLWTTEGNRAAVVAVVENAVRESGFATERSSAGIAEEKERLEKEILESLHKEVPKVKKVAGHDCYVAQIEHSEHGVEDCYVPVAQWEQGDRSFYALHDDGEHHRYILSARKEQNAVSVRAQDGSVKSPNGDKFEDGEVVIPLIHKWAHKYSRKNSVYLRLAGALRTDVLNIQGRLDNILKDISKQKAAFAAEMDTPFVREDVQKIAMEGVEDQLQVVRQESADCDRLLDLIGDSPK